MKIVFDKDDLKPLMYFIISMFQQENTHRQGTSSKSDLIGGVIDRWINKIPEDVIFRKDLLVDKDYSVINDYFIYGSSSEKNAPDILGLSYSDQVIKFTEYVNNSWVQIKDMPYIEIKTFRKNQKLLTVRESQLDDDKYYIFVESDINQDYLINFFEKQYYCDKILEKIKMSDEFIKSNSKGILIQPPAISIDDRGEIGTLEIITVIKGSDFKKYATLCNKSEDVVYLKGFTEVSGIRGNQSEKMFTDVFEYDSESDMYKAKWDEKNMVAMSAENIDELKILKINKTSFYCESSKKCSVSKLELDSQKVYKFTMEAFKRKSDWVEYAVLKSDLFGAWDCREDLILLFENIVKNHIDNTI